MAEPPSRVTTSDGRDLAETYFSVACRYGRLALLRGGNAAAGKNLPVAGKT
jgi:hypothetical protein